MENAQEKLWASCKHGRFVGLTIHPVATVQYLKDEQATREASQLKGQTYVGFIQRPKLWRGQRRRYASATIQFVGIGLPTHNVERHSGQFHGIDYRNLY